ncbi:uncharacterized protein RAG0_02175 [Rhynchosporium agropyri]|uniref:Heterokaryon incompatibility domain-containing protein n=1 Tax=Rhynchosporium agropyri TaxID=914238 RepID=A0A1E1K0I6_9HELO|nr:uncharacterized protein RAG0_02175 [Rhynchosporium agropyri]
MYHREFKACAQRLRPKLGEQDLVMWVDAICINQADIPKRNGQTANRRAIYQYAESVAVFLGMESSRSAGAMRFARDFNKRQYWWRIWVIQEVSSAPEATVYCGEDEISWTEFDKICDLLQEAEEELQSLFYKHPSYTRTLTTGGLRGL